MVLAHLSVKVGKAGKAHAHAAYISRSGKYENRLEKGERLLATESGNMPKWAQKNPLEFWLAADANERANGTTYREMEIALPRELSDRKLVDLVQQWVKQELGEKHAYQWAIHIPKAADGGEQPHVHLMFSERQLDGIERDPETYFKRYNSKAPEKGGARKGYGEHAGQTLSCAERADDLKKLRGRWQKTCNDYLHWNSDSKARIDMRSYAERGLDTEAEPKQLPSAWRGEGRAAILEMRAAKAEVKQLWPDIERHGKLLTRYAEETAKAERLFHEASGYEKEQRQEALEKITIETAVLVEELAAGCYEPAGIARRKEVDKRLEVRREQLAAEERAAKEAQTKAEAEARAASALKAQREKEAAHKLRLRQAGVTAEEQQRLQGMSSHEIGAEITRLRPPSVQALVSEVPEVRAADEEVQRLAGIAKRFREESEQAQNQAQGWRQKHRFRAVLHDKGLLPSRYLERCEQQAREADNAAQRVSSGYETALVECRDLKWAWQERIEREQLPLRSKLDCLQEMRQEKAQEEQEAARQAAEKREVQGALEQFKAFAAVIAQESRWGRESPTRAGLGEQWQTIFDAYNHAAEDGKAEILKVVAETPGVVQSIRQGLERAQTQSRGMSM